MIRAVCQLIQQHGGQLVDFQSEIADEIARMDAGCGAAVKGAGIAVAAGGLAQVQPPGNEKGSDLALLLAEGERIGNAGEILDSVEVYTTADDGDTDGADALFEDVFAMAGGFHPEGVKLRSAAGYADVFRGEDKPDTRMREARGESRLAVKLMRDGTPAGHELSVLAGGMGEAIIPAKRRKVTREALAVDTVEQNSLVALRSGRV